MTTLPPHSARVQAKLFTVINSTSVFTGFLFCDTPPISRSGRTGTRLMGGGQPWRAAHLMPCQHGRRCCCCCSSLSGDQQQGPCGELLAGSGTLYLSHAGHSLILNVTHYGIICDAPTEKKYNKQMLGEREQDDRLKEVHLGQNISSLLQCAALPQSSGLPSSYREGAVQAAWLTSRRLGIEGRSEARCGGDCREESGGEEQKRRGGGRASVP